MGDLPSELALEPVTLGRILRGGLHAVRVADLKNGSGMGPERAKRPIAEKAGSRWSPRGIICHLDSSRHTRVSTHAEVRYEATPPTPRILVSTISKHNLLLPVIARWAPTFSPGTFHHGWPDGAGAGALE